MPTTIEPSADADTRLAANKAVIRSFIDAWNTRGFDRFEALMGDDAVLRIGGAVVSCNPQARAPSPRSGRRRFQTGASTCWP